MGQTFERDTQSIKIKGIAWAGGGRGINRVEVSIDAGRNFRPAILLPKPDEVRAAEWEPSHGMGRCWTWQQWEMDFPLTDQMKKSVQNGERIEIEICARARDGDFNVQPQSVEDSYNVLGKCVNHWPRRVVYLDPKYANKDTAIVPPSYPMPPAGQWIWRRHYPVRVDLDDPKRYNKDFETESVKLDTPTPPKSKWW
jgi:hypothetical protein